MPCRGLGAGTLSDGTCVSLARYRYARAGRLRYPPTHALRDIWYAIALRACYAIPGTDIAEGALSPYALRGAMRGAMRRPPTGLLRDARY
eukprot:2558929-Rhodomonas_salina.1